MNPTLSVHQAAQMKQEKRRAAAGVGEKGLNLLALDRIGHRLLGERKLEADSYETLALGIMRRAEVLIVCSKGFKFIDSPEAALLIAQLEIPALKELIVLVDPQPLDESAQSHLHSEMAIVQWLVVNVGCPKEKLKSWGLEIACIEKGVCPDCSGWLNRHGIPHCTPRPTVAKLGWTSPLSSAFYKYKGNELQYNKGALTTMQSKTTAYTGHAKSVFG